MKVKILAIVCLGLLSLKAYSQDENAAIELYNQVVQAVQTEDFASAITKANEAYELVKDGSDELKTNLEQLIPKLYLNKANKSLSDSKFEEAAKEFAQTSEVAKKFNNADVQKDADNSILKVYLSEADNLYKADNFDGAIAAFDKALAIDSTNAQAYLIKAAAYAKKEDNKNAIATFGKLLEVSKATENEAMQKQAATQLSALYVKESNAAAKNKKWDDVISNAEKSLEYKPEGNASALKLRDMGNLQLGNSLKDSNKTKACQHLKKVTSDEGYKATAKQLLTALGC